MNIQMLTVRTGEAITSWTSADRDQGRFFGHRALEAQAAADSGEPVEVFPGELWPASEITAKGALSAIVAAGGSDPKWEIISAPGQIYFEVLTRECGTSSS
jgi:hypothetical protein